MSEARIQPLSADAHAFESRPQPREVGEAGGLEVADEDHAVDVTHRVHLAPGHRQVDHDREFGEKRRDLRRATGGVDRRLLQSTAALRRFGHGPSHHECPS